MTWFYILLAIGIIIWFIRGARSDEKPFEHVRFRIKFDSIIKHFVEGYFKEECDLHEPLKSEVRLIGKGIHSNKMVRLFFSSNFLFVDIRIKLSHIEYKKQYKISDPLIKSEEALVDFADGLTQDFGEYLYSKTQ